MGEQKSSSQNPRSPDPDSRWFHDKALDIALTSSSDPMNFFKDNLLHWREHKLSVQADERVIVHCANLQVRGNLHRLLPTNFSTPLSAAFVADAHSSDQTNFILYTGGIKIPICSSMTLHPSLEIASSQQASSEDDSQHLIISLHSKDGKSLLIKLSDRESFQQWHKALCEAIAEMIFTAAFQRTSSGVLPAHRIESAMRRAGRLVPAANCHMLRAKRLWTVKQELQDMLRRPHSLGRETVRNFLVNSQVDRLIVEDADFLRLQALEPTLPWSTAEEVAPAPAADSSDMQNISLNHTSYSSPIVQQGADALSMSPIRRVRTPPPPQSISPIHRRGLCQSMLPTISAGCEEDEEDVHCMLCTPEEVRGSGGRRSSEDIYRQLDELIDLLSDFSVSPAPHVGRPSPHYLSTSSSSSSTSSAVSPLDIALDRLLGSAVPVPADEETDRLLASCSCTSSPDDSFDADAIAASFSCAPLPPASPSPPPASAVQPAPTPSRSPSRSLPCSPFNTTFSSPSSAHPRRTGLYQHQLLKEEEEEEEEDKDETEDKENMPANISPLPLSPHPLVSSSIVKPALPVLLTQAAPVPVSSTSEDVSMVEEKEEEAPSAERHTRHQGRLLSLLLAVLVCALLLLGRLGCLLNEHRQPPPLAATVLHIHFPPAPTPVPATLPAADMQMQLFRPTTVKKPPMCRNKQFAALVPYQKQRWRGALSNVFNAIKNSVKRFIGMITLMPRKHRELLLG